MKNSILNKMSMFAFAAVLSVATLSGFAGRAEAGNVYADRTSFGKALNVPLGCGSNLKVDGACIATIYDTVANDQGQNWNTIPSLPGLVVLNTTGLCLNAAPRSNSLANAIPNMFPCSSTDPDMKWSKDLSLTSNNYRPSYQIRKTGNNGTNTGYCLARTSNVNLSRLKLITCNVDDVNQRWTQN
jgi:hypothetical protein